MVEILSTQDRTIKGMGKTMSSMSIADVESSSLRAPRVIVARPSAYGMGATVRRNAIAEGSLPVRVVEIQPGDRIGFLTVVRAEYVPLGHRWSHGSWECGCREDTCYAWHAVGGTVTRCSKRCECKRIGWKIFLVCDCGDTALWTFESAVLHDDNIARLTCRCSGGIAWHVEIAHRATALP